MSVVRDFNHWSGKGEAHSGCWIIIHRVKSFGDVFKREGVDLNIFSGNALYLADGRGRWPLGLQEITLTLQGHTCTFPVVVLSAEALACAIVLGLDFMCIIGM